MNRSYEASIISIIVPVYNAEHTLCSCVESILAQTHSALELILVDDGSTDGSPALCDAFAARDARVRVIHKANGRAASARNAGLRAATGDYIAFVDADDCIVPEMYEKMLQAGADVVLCDYVRFRGARELPHTHECIAAGFYDKTQLRTHVYPHLVMDALEYPITISNWAMLIRREVLVRNGLSYREDILISEDAPFGSEVLYCADSFAYLKGEYLYRYRMTDGSASKTYRSWWWDSFLKINEETERFFSSCTDFDFTQQIKANLFYLTRAELCYILQDRSIPRWEQTRRMREVMAHPRVVRVLRGMKLGSVPLSFRLLYWSIRLRSVALQRCIRLASIVRHGGGKENEDV